MVVRPPAYSTESPRHVTDGRVGNESGRWKEKSMSLPAVPHPRLSGRTLVSLLAILAASMVAQSFGGGHRLRAVRVGYTHRHGGAGR